MLTMDSHDILLYMISYHGWGIIGDIPYELSLPVGDIYLVKLFILIRINMSHTINHTYTQYNN